MRAPSSRTGLRSTQGVTAVVLATLALGALAALTGDVWLQLLAALLLGLVVAGFVLRPRVTDLVVDLDIAARSTLLVPAELHLRVRNEGRRRTPPTVLRVHNKAFSDVVVRVPALPPRGDVLLVAGTTPLVRGPAPSFLVGIEATDALGLARAARSFVVDRPVLVRPRVLGFHPPRGRGAAEDGTALRPERGGFEAHAPREWRPGDSARDVHWRSTARHGRLVVLDRGRPTEDRLTVLVLAAPGLAVEEVVVTAVASAAVAALRQGRPVALWSAQPGLAPLPDAVGEQVLDWCALLTAPGLPAPAALNRLLRRVGPDGDLVVTGSGLAAGPFWDLLVSSARAAAVRLDHLTDAGWVRSR